MCLESQSKVKTISGWTNTKMKLKKYSLCYYLLHIHLAILLMLLPLA